ncbi:putative plasmid stabilization system protein [Bradyrhizobium sp. ORS 278]|uniref:type II toxin-antitoxin system RelE/ParE family toxin n=1 Tax=Bradyrhizobium sp. (strain ORS 278) TaxID=114615 RepID=UPI0001507A13|nr:type II toxin-antitoxin system RelE/ParE family toxin [Bradyrhizobium sp. ORS 278]CAL74487.1 putative plasmid stabilization system protein [Bradyrhizobium sp. ORS 278]
MRVRWSQSSLTEIGDIFSYIHERSPTAAASVVARIDRLTSSLATFPWAGHVTDDPNVRVVSVVRYPFRIFYAIDQAADEVVILHVRHTAQDEPLE